MARHTRNEVDAEVEPAARSLAARAYAFVAAGPLSLLIIGAWIAAAALAALYLPGFENQHGSLSDLTPTTAPAITAERQAAELFAVPVLSRVAVVQRDAGGLSPATQRATVAAAAAVDRGTAPRPAGLLGAFPLVNDRRLIPAANEHRTAAITYLFFDPSLSWPDQVRAAQSYAAHDLGGTAVAGVTGSVPARLAQEDQIAARLTLVEVATVAVIALIVALAFGSLIAPLLTFLVGGVAYLVASRVVSWTGARYGFAPPPSSTR